ncbi:hypothetical protein GCM10027614_78520 [Micromonospora vulcania]
MRRIARPEQGLKHLRIQGAEVVSQGRHHLAGHRARLVAQQWHQFGRPGHAEATQCSDRFDPTTRTWMRQPPSHQAGILDATGLAQPGDHPRRQRLPPSKQAIELCRIRATAAQPA